MFLPETSNHLEDIKWIKSLRQSLAAYIDKNEYSFSKWEFDFEEKVSNQNTINTIRNILKKIDTDVGTKDEYSQFVNFYIRLEVMGITNERAGGKVKNSSFMSLLTDASHAYFGSKCDYLVSADAGGIN